MSNESRETTAQPEKTNTPKFIREFSKSNSAEERTVLAKEAQARLSELRKQLAQAEELKPEVAKQRAEIKSLIGSFYEREKEKWTKTPYNKEDIKRYFTEKNLTSLPMEDYILLLKRFPNEFVTNVVWQGVRDHPGIEGRLPGVYSNGFQEMLADGKLRSPFGKFLKDGFKKEAVARCLGLGNGTRTKEEALDILETYTNPEAQGYSTYADFIATHFAAEEVADHYYGAETGNEKFLIFPSAYINANYFFAGKLAEPGGGNHNDLWTWEEKGTGGIKIDVGILFVPADTKVDPQTGSRYQLDQNHKPIIDRDKISLVKNFVGSDKFSAFVAKAESLIKKETSSAGFAELKETLTKEFGITDPRLQEHLIYPKDLSGLKWAKDREASGQETQNDMATGKLQGVEAVVQDLLMDAGITYKEAETTIESQQYWEKYFADHPDQMPKRIVYYHGNDPTEAYLKWKEDSGLSKKTDDRKFGFPEREIFSYEDPRITFGMKRFRSIGKKVIEEFFVEKE